MPDSADAFDRATPVERVTAPADDGVTEAPAGASRRRSSEKIPYWDRPKPPRDLHWFLGRLGGALIVFGILVFLFVGYQLWGTGIEAAQSQDRLENQFTENAQTTVPSTDDPSTPPPIPAPVVVNEGDAVAILEMPTIGITKYVVAGVETADLKKGPGHYPNTPFPGELGNAAIAGHRTTYGEPFRQIDELQPGDPIIVTDLLGRKFVYTVTEQRIVQPEDSWVVDTVDSTIATLTLTTCHPEFSAKQRLIVSATLDLAQSTPAPYPAAVYAGNIEPPSGFGGLTEETTVPGSTAASIDPTTSSTSVPASTEPASTETSSAVSSSIVSSSTDAPPTTEPGAAAGDDGESSGTDVFDKGWFSDSRAYPHVIGWILLEVLIVMGAWQVAKRFRNRAIGAAVGFVPFVVTLYFVFQNVNRLLPPNL